MKRSTTILILLAMIAQAVPATLSAQIGGPHHRVEAVSLSMDSDNRRPASARELPTLPAEWTGLSGFRSPGVMMLRWSTSSERNSAWFKIEARPAGVSAWKVLDIIPAAGQSSTPRFYSWRHANPPLGEIEYRLRQIDSYGNEHSTGTLQVEAASVQELTLDLSGPVPASTETLIAISSGTPTTGSLAIHDGTGKSRLILFQYLELLPGSYRFRVDTSTLPDGAYTVRLVTGEKNITRRLKISR
jgi:hypothetical protein